MAVVASVRLRLVVVWLVYDEQIGERRESKVSSHLGNFLFPLQMRRISVKSKKPSAFPETGIKGVVRWPVSSSVSWCLWPIDVSHLMRNPAVPLQAE